jgi:hypothetical protein
MPFGIDRGAVFDAAGFGEHVRPVGGEVLQHGLALAGLRGEDGDDMDHGISSGFLGINRDVSGPDWLCEAPCAIACRDDALLECLQNSSESGHGGTLVCQGSGSAEARRRRDFRGEGISR